MPISDLNLADALTHKQAHELTAEEIAAGSRRVNAALYHSGNCERPPTAPLPEAEDADDEPPRKTPLDFLIEETRMRAVNIVAKAVEEGDLPAAKLFLSLFPPPPRGQVVTKVVMYDPARPFNEEADCEDGPHGA